MSQPISGNPDFDESDFTEEQEIVSTQRRFPWARILQLTAINMIIPLVNGLMLGFGEILAHELGTSWGWREARVYDPVEMAARKDRRKWLWFF